MKRTVTVLVATLLVTGVAWSKKPKPAPVPAPVAAEPATTGDPALEPVVKYRHALMEAMGEHFGMSKMVLDGTVVRQEDLVGHALALHALSRDLVSLFPSGTGPDAFETRALPAIWESDEKGREFADAAFALSQATLKFAEAAKTEDMGAAGAAFGEVGQSCGGCHKPFRKPNP